MTMFKKTELKDGTEGYRYSWGLTRKRQAKKRYGVANGKTMLGLHVGRHSLYVEKKWVKVRYKPAWRNVIYTPVIGIRGFNKPLWNFNAS